MGVNSGCPDDYDRLLEMIEQPSSGRLPSSVPVFVYDDEPEEPEELRFNTFQEAAAWAKNNKGKAFKRSADGTHFAPIEETNEAYGIASAAPKPPTQDTASSQANDTSGSVWLPGTYPTTDDEQLLLEKDIEHQRLAFWPVLKRLAPEVFRQARIASIGYALDVASFQFDNNTRFELQELLTILEVRLVRSIRWHATKREALFEDIKRREKERYINSSPETRAHDRRLKSSLNAAPSEVLFWKKAIEIVQVEHSRRKEGTS